MGRTTTVSSRERGAERTPSLRPGPDLARGVYDRVGLLLCGGEAALHHFDQDTTAPARDAQSVTTREALEGGGLVFRHDGAQDAQLRIRHWGFLLGSDKAPPVDLWRGACSHRL